MNSVECLACEEGVMAQEGHTCLTTPSVKKRMLKPTSNRLFECNNTVHFAQSIQSILNGIHSDEMKLRNIANMCKLLPRCSLYEECFPVTQPCCGVRCEACCGCHIPYQGSLKKISCLKEHCNCSKCQEEKEVSRLIHLVACNNEMVVIEKKPQEDDPKWKLRRFEKTDVDQQSCR